MAHLIPRNYRFRSGLQGFRVESHEWFPLGRVSPDIALQSLAGASFTLQDEEWAAELEVGSPDGPVGIAYPARDAEHASACRETMASLLPASTASTTSNSVRRWLRVSVPDGDPRDYMFYLAYVIVEPGKGVLSYFGSIVNTSWDANIVERDGRWEWPVRASPQG